MVHYFFVQSEKQYLAIKGREMKLKTGHKLGSSTVFFCFQFVC